MAMTDASAYNHAISDIFSCFHSMPPCFTQPQPLIMYEELKII